MGGLLITGITESAIVNNVIVSLKILVVLAVIAIGFGHIHPAYWHPFIPPRSRPARPRPWGTSAFPHPDRRRGDLLRLHRLRKRLHRRPGGQEPAARHADRHPGSLAICTVLYILMSLVITGITPYTTLNNEAPVAIALGAVPGLGWLRQAVNVAVAIGLGSTILSLLYGQSRIFYAMARDGLLPPLFGTINPLTHTPIWARRSPPSPPAWSRACSPSPSWASWCRWARCSPSP